MGNVCILVGAGASHDVWVMGPKEDKFQPPLTQQLFARRFSAVLQEYAGALMLAQELGPLADRGALDLASKLLECAKHQDEEIRKAFRRIPPYLRDLFVSTRRYCQGTGSYAVLLKKVLADHQHRALLMSLNYDDFLDRALWQIRPTYTPTWDLSGYAELSRSALLVKLHGSVDWFVPLGPAESWDEAVDAYDLQDPAGPPYKHSNYPGIRQQAALKFDASGSSRQWSRMWPYPVMTAPLAAKDASSFVCPSSHVDAAREFLAKADKVLIVGYSGLDAHVLNLLEESLPNEPVPAQLVGWNDASVAAGRFIHSVPKLGRLSDSAAIRTEGFSSYVLSNEVDKFLAS